MRSASLDPIKPTIWVISMLATIIIDPTKAYLLGYERKGSLTNFIGRCSQRAAEKSC